MPRPQKTRLAGSGAMLDVAACWRYCGPLFHPPWVAEWRVLFVGNSMVFRLLEGVGWPA
jgi:hypothetical protein